MTDQHPLSDAKCRDIANNVCFRWPRHVDQGEVLYGEDDMRAAADWQLEQVIKFIAKEDTVYYDTPTLLADYIKKAMRPTTT
jgi:hypothetical protein